MSGEQEQTDPLIDLYESLSYQERKMLMQEWDRRNTNGQASRG